MTMASHAVLVVDDDGLTTSQVAWLLEESGHRWDAAATVAEALAKLETSTFDAVLLDVYLPDGSGLVVLERALKIDAGPVVLMMTARAEIKNAVDAMRHGAADFIEKPLDLDDLRTRLERALDTAAMRRKLAVYEAKDRDLIAPVSQSAAFRKTLALADRVASTPSSSALLLGESGVGKEVLAAKIHSLSNRRKAPFVRVNLAAIPDSMIEAELFGSIRGAYTDSKRDRAGHFASAEGGTLLLDEIGEFKIELQAKLLRVLENKAFFPVGADRERRTNVRVLAATNRDPHELIERGLLREDLYYRLATVEIVIPPLRERAEDVLPLAEHFLSLFAREFNRGHVRLSLEATRAIQAYPWPGNVRELRNAI
ncbi:MAG: sigma-54 dependent transcriptional regulator [Polyangiaceae bacterium]